MSERPQETLAIDKDGVARTASKEVGCVMQVVSFITDDSQVFRYKTHMMADYESEVEWSLDTMFVVIPADVATFLLRENYARRMTAEEVDDYNRQLSINGEKT